MHLRLCNAVFVINTFKKAKGLVSDRRNRVVFILGAGASRNSGIPLVKEWLPLAFFLRRRGKLTSEVDKALHIIPNYSVNFLKEHFEKGEEIILGLRHLIGHANQTIIDRGISVLQEFVFPARANRLTIEDTQPEKFQEINQVLGKTVVHAYSEIGRMLSRKERLHPHIEELLSCLINLEEMIGAVDLAIVQTESKNEHLSRFSTATLSHHFSMWFRRNSEVRQIHDSAYGILYQVLTRSMKQVRDPYPSLARFIKKNLARTSLITFNYDNLLEQALTNLGVPCNYGINMEVKKSSIRIDREGFFVNKFHGSVWWWSEKESLKKSYNESLRTRCYADSVIIPPTTLKFAKDPDILELWTKARDQIEDADVVLVVGYSFPRIDEHAVNIIRKGLQKNAKSMIIVDPHPNKEQFRDISPAFLEGSAEQILPMLLR